MQLHQLKPIHRAKSHRRVGRGGKRGTYSGRGVKGQSSRAGRKMKPYIRELIKRYPKLRGYRFASSGEKITVLNLYLLEKHFNQGETVSPQILLDKKLVRKIKGMVPQIKILGEGSLTKALTFENCLVSKQAKEKIEKVNGTVK